MRIVRDVFRRKGRSFLTIFGVTIGVIVLVVMGSMVEKINKLVSGSVDAYENKVAVVGQVVSDNYADRLTSIDLLDEIRAVQGVDVVSGAVQLSFDDSEGPLILKDSIEGSDLEGERFKIVADQGRLLTKDDSGVVVLGYDLAMGISAELGDVIDIRAEEFEVVGIIEKTLAAPDNTAYMSLADAQRLFHATLPAATRDAVDPATIVNDVMAYPEPGVDANDLAETINNEVDEVVATGPAESIEAVKDTMQYFSAILTGIGLIALLVSSLSVVNTMMMSVSERVREIGIRRAIGASTGSIVRHFVGESAVIGLVAGVVGLGLGAVLVIVGNALGAESGNTLFLLTPRLAGGSVAFALVLGIIAGIYPALKAARLNPVVAFRRG